MLIAGEGGGVGGSMTVRAGEADMVECLLGWRRLVGVVEHMVRIREQSMVGVSCCCC